MKKMTGVLLLVLAAASVATAQSGIRPILSGQWDLYFNDAERAELTGRISEKNFFNVTGVSLFPFAPWLSVESKVEMKLTLWTPPGTDGSMTLSELEAGGLIGSDWWQVTLSIAPIMIRAPFYFIVRPGIAFGNGVETTEQSSDRIAPSYDLAVDANLETARLYANATVRGSWHRPQNLWFVLPSAGAAVSLSDRVRTGAKVFWSYTRDYGNDSETTNLAGLITADVRVGERATLLTGVSAAWTPGSNELDGSAYVGITFPATDAITMKYQVAPILRQNAGPGISNIFVMDARL